MKLTGLHLLLTFRCTLSCDHCFTWGSPRQSGVMAQGDIREILRQAGETGTIKTIYFEGGEPFLYYAALLHGVREAAAQGYQTGIVTNGFWAISEEDALAALEPFAGVLHMLTLSCDLFHWSQADLKLARYGIAAAEKLGIPVGTIAIDRPEAESGASVTGQIPEGESGVMFRGRAAVKLARFRRGKPWDEFTACPHENLREPGRVHLDPLGNLHICQGISVGNIFRTPLADICRTYDPDAHPIAGPLLRGGPAELVRQYGLAHQDRYADACHLCYAARLALRPAFPEALAPGQVYGQF